MDDTSYCAQLREAVRVEDWDTVEALEARHLTRIEMTEGAAWHRALSQAPDDWLRERPVLAFVSTMSLASGGGFNVPDPEPFERLIGWVEAQQNPPVRARLFAEVGLLQYQKMIGNYGEMSATIDRMEVLLDETTDYRSLGDLTPVLFLPMAIGALILGDAARARGFLGEARRRGAKAGPHPILPHVQNYLALVYALEGDFGAAREYAADWVGRVEAPVGSLPAVYQGDAVMIAALLAMGDLDRARTDAAIASIPSTVEGDDLWWVAAHVRARRALLWGDRIVAARSLERLLAENAALAGAGTLVHTLLATDLSDLYQYAGDLFAASRSLENVHNLDPSSSTSRARLALLHGDIHAVREQLPVESGPRGYQSTAPAEWLALRARAERLDGDDARANDLAVTAARSALVHGSRMAVIEADPKSGDMMLDAWGSPAIDAAQCMILQQPAILTAREEEVLGLLHETGSAQQIATALFLSVSTVKTHLRAVYRKLGVRSREEALVKAAGVANPAR
ncbi:helix-turn-helix transcriptional regulator [Microbacterium sp. A84]|uniref:helix-turn-helix transcriptional regulator n=1 Tax=Microbacterium sp. A84 TaxID=3450715 RepID=UPI003F4429D8